MRKGISPIVAVVLLIAIAVIAAVGLYFWVGGLATKQPTPNNPHTITATCTGGTVIVSNIGANEIPLASMAGLVDSVAGAPDVAATCTGVTLASGDSCVALTGADGTTGYLYAPDIAQAQYSCA